MTTYETYKDKKMDMIDYDPRKEKKKKKILQVWDPESPALRNYVADDSATPTLRQRVTKEPKAVNKLPSTRA